MNDEIISNENMQPAVSCLHCGNPDIVKDVPNALCNECRAAAIKFPIPLWVKIFGGAVSLLVIFSLMYLPQNLTVGLSLEKGIKAEKENKYVTAQRYFEQVARLDSNNTEANARLLIAAYYNNDMLNFLKASNRLDGKNIDDDQLLNTVNGLVATINYHFASDSFYSVEQQYSSIDDIPDSVYLHYIKTDDDNVYEKVFYASTLFDHKNYVICDSLIHVILNTDYDNLNALGLMASTKRFENQLDSAIYYCDRMLVLNNEFNYARCLKARALLKMKRNDEALQLALDCKKADSTDAYALATLALVYHFNNQPAQRDAVLQQAEGLADDSSTMQVFQYVHDVINNKESL